MNYPFQNVLDNSTFEIRLSRQIQAIGSQIKRYRLTYLNKSIPPSNIQNYVKFSKQLLILMTSHCQNIIFVAPQKLSAQLQSLKMVFDDLINKYYQLFVSHHNQQLDNCRAFSRTKLQTGLCARCEIQKKKVSIELTKMELFNETNENDYQKQPRETTKYEDIQFFNQLNQLLNIKHGQLLKNQMEITVFKDFAENAIKSLNSLGKYFSRESVIIPETNWMNQAKGQIENIMKNGFEGKVAPWIQKMFRMFFRFYQKYSQQHMKQVSVQTNDYTNHQIMQLKRKILRLNEKLQKSTYKTQDQNQQLNTAIYEKKDLQLKVGLYKGQLDTLISEIQRMKAQNLTIMKRLSNQNYCRSKQQEQQKELQQPVEFELSTKGLISTHKMKTKKYIQLMINKNLPKIKSNDENRTSLTSIKDFAMVKSQSQDKNRKSSRIQKLSGLSLNSTMREKDKKLIENKISVQKSVSVDMSMTQESNIKQNHILRQIDYSQQRKEVHDVNTIMKQNIKNKMIKTTMKKFFTPIPRKVSNDTLKKVPRNTLEIDKNKNENEVKKKRLQHTEKSSFYTKVIKNEIKQNDKVFQKILKFLSDTGYMKKLNDEQYKILIVKIKNLDIGIIGQQELDRHLKKQKKIMKSQLQTYQKHSDNRNTWNMQSFYIPQSGSQEIQQDTQNIQQIQKRYYFIFNSEENAYNYEISLTKNHYGGIYNLSKIEEKHCQQIFKIIETIKAKDFNHYKFICSYLRYPFQVMKNDFGVINLVNEMKYNNFHQYYQRLMGIHIKCKKQDGLCCHFQELRSKLKEKMQSFQ